MAAPTKTPRTKKPVPCWVTCWPDWFGMHGNVTVVPESDYQALERELAAALAEVKRLNEWADGMTDAALKERQTGEMYQRELRAEIERLRQQQDELARQVGLEVWHIGATLRRPDMRPIIARVRAEMEKEKGNG